MVPEFQVDLAHRAIRLVFDAEEHGIGQRPVRRQIGASRVRQAQLVSQLQQSIQPWFGGGNSDQDAVAEHTPAHHLE